MNKIYFTADLHFGHSNILKHSPKRPFSDTVDIVAHDEWLLDLWKSTVDKRDTVYILGDLTFLKSENARHLLEKLPGQKFLIEGNHDGSIRAYKNSLCGDVPLSYGDMEPKASRIYNASWS